MNGPGDSEPRVDISIVIPARDEESFLGGCLDSIDRAAACFPCRHEVIVVANRCTDRTEEIALARGARIVRDDSKNLSRIRNAGARAAHGEILITIDADSRMSENMLAEITRALRSGRFVGGGVPIRPERLSAGILASALLLFVFVVPPGISAGLFWMYRRDFDALGGFDETKVIAEDVDFARRLRAFGRARGQKFGTLYRTRIITSCRKFDRFGDWFLVRQSLRHPRRLRDAIRGEGREFADTLFYDFKRRP